MEMEEMKKFIGTYENIKNVRKKIKTLEEKKKMLQSNKEQLEQDSRVRKYLLQLAEIDKVKRNILGLKIEHPDWNWNEEQVIKYYALHQEINKYYVCIGAHPQKFEKFVGYSGFPDYECIIPASHTDAAYKIYISLEYGVREVRKLDECEEFEKIHKVIYLEEGNTFDFDKFKNDFYHECIKNADRECIQKVLNIKKER